MASDRTKKNRSIPETSQRENLSRSAKTANITLVDNVIRAIPNIEKWVKKIGNKEEMKLREIVKSWDNEKMLLETLKFISKRLNSLFLL